MGGNPPTPQSREVGVVTLVGGAHLGMLRVYVYLFISELLEIWRIWASPTTLSFPDPAWLGLAWQTFFYDPRCPVDTCHGWMPLWYFGVCPQARPDTREPVAAAVTTPCVPWVASWGLHWTEKMPTLYGSSPSLTHLPSLPSSQCLPSPPPLYVSLFP